MDRYKIREGHSLKDIDQTAAGLSGGSEHHEEMPLNVVAIGGGSGLSVLLRGLKQVTKNVTAIVTVADDGGGSGILREDLGMLPPGDIRNCILALANREPILMDLMNYRFQEGMLKGQNFGNLMLAALVGISENFEEAVKKINDIFAVTGQVLPVTTEDVSLRAVLSNGVIVEGESKIPKAVLEEKSPISHVSLVPKKPKPTAEVITAIENADLILMGPGSLFTSVIPNLLVEGVSEAIQKSSAIKIYIANLMSQPGETDGFSLSDYHFTLAKHSFSGIVSHIMVNQEPIDPEILKRYEAEHAAPVVITAADRAYFQTVGVQLIEGDFMETVKGYVRHDALKVSEEAVSMVDAKVYKKSIPRVDRNA